MAGQVALARRLPELPPGGQHFVDRPGRKLPNCAARGQVQWLGQLCQVQR